MNSALGDRALREKVLEQVFDTYWPQFEIGFNNILESTDVGIKTPARTEESILTEVLRTVRSMDRRVRHLEKPTLVKERHFEHLSPTVLEHRVYQLLKDGMRPEDVEEALTGSAPIKYIRRAISRALSVVNDEKEQDQDEG